MKQREGYKSGGQRIEVVEMRENPRIFEQSREREADMKQGEGYKSVV
jgi:hypothetical protein